MSTNYNLLENTLRTSEDMLYRDTTATVLRWGDGK